MLKLKILFLCIIASFVSACDPFSVGMPSEGNLSYGNNQVLASDSTGSFSGTNIQTPETPGAQTPANHTAEENIQQYRRFSASESNAPVFGQAQSEQSSDTMERDDESGTPTHQEDGATQEVPPAAPPLGTTTGNTEHVGPEVDITLNIQTPYDVPENERYALQDGVHNLWVYDTDKPHSENSDTNPRSEIAIRPGYGNSGIHEFEADFYVPQETNHTTIMQVFGATTHATSLMLNVNDGNLTPYSKTDNPIATNIYDRWFHLNVIHNAESNEIKVYIDGQLAYTHEGEHGEHYFKCGVYNKEGASAKNTVMIKNIHVYSSN